MCFIFQQLLQDVASSLLKSPYVQSLFPPVNLWRKWLPMDLGGDILKQMALCCQHRQLSEGNGSACMFYDKRLCSNSASDTNGIFTTFVIIFMNCQPHFREILQNFKFINQPTNSPTSGVLPKRTL